MLRIAIDVFHLAPAFFRVVSFDELARARVPSRDPASGSAKCRCHTSGDPCHVRREVVDQQANRFGRVHAYRDGYQTSWQVGREFRVAAAKRGVKVGAAIRSAQRPRCPPPAPYAHFAESRIGKVLFHNLQPLRPAML